MNNLQPYVSKDFQKQKPFSSFLSGIAGKMGIPLWAFYVNRGQLISSFGVRDKNGAIMEFFPANSGYHHVPRLGFRTFVLVEGRYHEFFKEPNPGQSLHVRPDQVAIEEVAESLGLKLKVTYFLLPEAEIGALCRKVEITNLQNKPRDVELVDGLAQIMPSGVGYGEYKAISNLLQSWMQTGEGDGFITYKLRASTADSSEVSVSGNINFFLTDSKEIHHYVYDYKSLFREDTSLETPYGFLDGGVDNLQKSLQCQVNQVPCGFTAIKFPGLVKSDFVSVYGYASDIELVRKFRHQIQPGYFAAKEKRNTAIHQELMASIDTVTAEPLFDQYLGQCYLDNVLRGGKPMLVDTLDGKIGYHLYSRKHGDPERDYNFFHLEPTFYSQGNGNFRDVLQNRRNDVFFDPLLGDFNIMLFASLIQADGYNPLGIEGIAFHYEGDTSGMAEAVVKLLKKDFTPGELAKVLFDLDQDIEPEMLRILAKCYYVIRANYGEGYWEDHFTYLYDLIDSYLAVWPDKEKEVLFSRMLPFFVSPVSVRPRNEKYAIRKDGLVRQYGALHHEQDTGSKWLMGPGKPIKVNLFGKLLTLLVNKYAHLDQFGIGLSYEADRPGWNDAMNGLPGLFGSGVSETIELLKIAKFLFHRIDAHHDQPVLMLVDTWNLFDTLGSLTAGTEELSRFEARMTALENYRKRLHDPQNMETRTLADCRDTIGAIVADLTGAVEKARALALIPPTYLTYTATKHHPYRNDSDEPLIGDYGLPLTDVKAFRLEPLPAFLEAPSRLLQSGLPTEAAKTLHEAIKKSDIYDQKLKFFKTSGSLEKCDNEIGRIRAFTPGWLERESNFLHMTYKYLLGLLKSGLYAEFFSEIRTNFTCFMDPSVYGRAPVENSSFLASSVNPDPKRHGQGFVARLSGSTAEVISMWRLMFFGETLFRMCPDGLVFQPKPILHHSFFREGIASTTLFGKTALVYHNASGEDTYAPGMEIARIVLKYADKTTTFAAFQLVAGPAEDIRAGKVYKIDVFLEKNIGGIK